MHDLVIRNGTIVDGTGAAPRIADIAIDAGRITAVGPDLPAGSRVIDAGGLIVTPGFIDVHTHYDAQVMWDARLAPTVWHGVTSAIIGNCGVGFAPARDGDRAELIDMMATVEDIPVESLEAGLAWGWESYPQYLDAVAARPRTIEIGSMITHAPLRIYVMGSHAHDDPSPAERGRMCDLVRDGMRAGAVGLSTSRTMLHTTSDGVTIPGTDAGYDELLALARAVREGGDGVRGVLEVSPAGIAYPEPKALRDEVDLLVQVAAGAGCPVVFSLVQSNFGREDYRAVLDRIEAAQRDGVQIYAEVSSRPISTMLGFQGAFNPFAHLPSYAPLLGMSMADRVAALRDPAVRARLLSEEVPPIGLAQVFMADGFWDDVFPMGSPLSYYPNAEDSIQRVADRSGQDPKAVAYDAMLERDGRAFLMYTINNWGERNRGALRAMVNSPAAILGLADGGAHVTAISDSSQATTFLMDWVRGRAAGDPDGMPIETAVHKLTLANAALFGLHDRGAIRPGLRADLNLIDLAALDVIDPEMVHDLPCDRPRLDQRARGYVATLVAGEVVQENGTLTGKLPGGLIRGGALTF